MAALSGFGMSGGIRSTPQARKPWEVMGKQSVAASRRLTSRAAADAVWTRNARGDGRVRTIQVAELSLEVEDAIGFASASMAPGREADCTSTQALSMALKEDCQAACRSTLSEAGRHPVEGLWKRGERCLLDCGRTLPAPCMM